ncbi:MAG: hypothetical protein K6G83_02095 [Lachnospiraceae bacterium]|nr:hypothetical protein [Lachnospiraceae bacterium]
MVNKKNLKKASTAILTAILSAGLSVSVFAAPGGPEGPGGVGGPGQEYG